MSFHHSAPPKALKPLNAGSLDTLHKLINASTPTLSTDASLTSTDSSPLQFHLRRTVTQLYKKAQDFERHNDKEREYVYLMTVLNAIVEQIPKAFGNFVKVNPEYGEWRQRVERDIFPRAEMLKRDLKKMYAAQKSGLKNEVPTVKVASPFKASTVPLTTQNGARGALANNGASRGVLQNGTSVAPNAYGASASFFQGMVRHAQQQQNGGSSMRIPATAQNHQPNPMTSSLSERMDKLMQGRTQPQQPRFDQHQTHQARPSPPPPANPRNFVISLPLPTTQPSPPMRAALRNPVHSPASPARTTTTMHNSMYDMKDLAPPQVSKPQPETKPHEMQLQQKRVTDAYQSHVHEQEKDLQAKKKMMDSIQEMTRKMKDLEKKSLDLDRTEVAYTAETSPAQETEEAKKLREELERLQEEYERKKQEVEEKRLKQIEALEEQIERERKEREQRQKESQKTQQMLGKVQQQLASLEKESEKSDAELKQLLSKREKITKEEQKKREAAEKLQQQNLLKMKQLAEERKLIEERIAKQQEEFEREKQIVEEEEQKRKRLEADLQRQKEEQQRIEEQERQWEKERKEAEKLQKHIEKQTEKQKKQRKSFSAERRQSLKPNKKRKLKWKSVQNFLGVRQRSWEREGADLDLEDDRADNVRSVFEVDVSGGTPVDARDSVQLFVPPVEQPEDEQFEAVEEILHGATTEIEEDPEEPVQEKHSEELVQEEHSEEPVQEKHSEELVQEEHSEADNSQQQLVAGTPVQLDANGPLRPPQRPPSIDLPDLEDNLLLHLHDIQEKERLTPKSSAEQDEVREEDPEGEDVEHDHPLEAVTEASTAPHSHDSDLPPKDEHVPPPQIQVEHPAQPFTITTSPPSATSPPPPPPLPTFTTTPKNISGKTSPPLPLPSNHLSPSSESTEKSNITSPVSPGLLDSIRAFKKNNLRQVKEEDVVKAPLHAKGSSMLMDSLRDSLIQRRQAIDTQESDHETDSTDSDTDSDW